MRKIISGLAIIGAVLQFSALGAPAAQAAAGAYGCSGSLIDTYAVKTSSGTRYGTINLYYNSSTGKNCAANVANSTGGYGSSKPMEVNIIKCAQKSPSNICTSLAYDNDYGSFKYHAGPVSVTAPNNCIWVYGMIKWNGKTANGSSGISHCS